VERLEADIAALAHELWGSHRTARVESRVQGNWRINQHVLDLFKGS
jgi:hypothetical protein